MFEHRLGLALGMTLGQIKALPLPEYRSWRAYYKVEPFGWQNDEYRLAYLMALLYNKSVSKRSDAKSTKDFMRDPEKAIENRYNEAKLREKWLKATKKERMQMLAATFGGAGIKTKVANGNSSNDSGKADA
jgi:hypothetical protein